MEVYFDAQCLEADSKGTPDMDSYIRFRRGASGCNPCFTLIEYANGLNLPDEVFEDPAIRTLQETANDIVSWSNVRLSPATSNLLLTVSARVGYRIVRYRTSSWRNSEHGRYPHGTPWDESPRSREPRRRPMRGSHQTVRRKQETRSFVWGRPGSPRHYLYRRLATLDCRLSQLVLRNREIFWEGSTRR